MLKWLKRGRNLPSIPLNPQPGDFILGPWGIKEVGPKKGVDTE